MNFCFPMTPSTGSSAEREYALKAQPKSDTSTPVKRRSMPLISFEGSVRPQESSRPTRRPLATSAPPSTAAIRRGRSSGTFWRSASIVTTTSPRARTSPACIAGCWPKFRLKRTARTRGSAATRRSTTAQVPSLEPSSTTITSNGFPSSSSVAVARRQTSSSVASSLKTGTTRLISGSGSSTARGAASATGFGSTIRARLPVSQASPGAVASYPASSSRPAERTRRPCRTPWTFSTTAPATRNGAIVKAWRTSAYDSASDLGTS